MPAYKPSGIGNVSALATSGTITPDASTANTFTCALAGKVTMNGPSNPVDGQKVVFRFTNDASHVTTFATGAVTLHLVLELRLYSRSF